MIELEVKKVKWWNIRKLREEILLVKLFLESKIHYVLLIETQIKTNTGRQAVTVVCTHLTTSLQIHPCLSFSHSKPRPWIFCSYIYFQHPWEFVFRVSTTNSPFLPYFTLFIRINRFLKRPKGVVKYCVWQIYIDLALEIVNLLVLS